MNHSRQMFLSCILVIFGAFLFGCGSQIQNQAQSLSITVPAVMTAEDGIQESVPIIEAQPAWLVKCLAKSGDVSTSLAFEQSPKLDLKTLALLSHHLKFEIRGHGWIPLDDVGTVQLRYQRLGRIVGRLQIEDPNIPTLGAMHDFSLKIKETKESAGTEDPAEMSWSRAADSNIWQSSPTILIVTVTPPNKLRWSLVVGMSFKADEITMKFLRNAGTQPTLNSVSIDYKSEESNLEKLGRSLFVPDYSGILSFHPEYVEILIQKHDGDFDNICFQVH